MATTLRPACASGSTATPPLAPRPMMTTSAVDWRALVAVEHPLPPEAGARRLRREHPHVVRGDVRRLQTRIELLIARRHRESKTRITEQIPADEVRVAAVVGIAECAVNRVRADEREESG